MARSVFDITFHANSHVPSAGELLRLRQSVPALQGTLRDFPELMIVIEGYADDWLTLEYNERLAWRRADTVRRVLLESGFPEESLEVLGIGYRAPQCPAYDSRCHQHTRCVRFRAAMAMAQSATRAVTSRRVWEGS